MEVEEEGDYIPIASMLHCHHQNDSRIKTIAVIGAIFMLH